MKTFIFSKLKAAKQSIQSTFSSERIQMVDISKLKFDKDFKELFAQEPDKVERIAADMMERGYDKSQPIIVTKDFAILDGNSRYLACQKAGITTVPIILKDFADKDEALRYELHLQVDRRNLSDAEIFKIYNKLEEMKAKAKAQGKKIESFTDRKYAEKLKVSERQVQKIRELSRKADEATIQKVTTGEITINQALKGVKAAETENKTKLPKSSDYVEFRRGVAFAVRELEKGKTPQEILAMAQEA